MFYDVILRRRNWANAAFCCGAASVHRREAVMQAALRSYVWSVDAEIARHTRDIRDRQRGKRCRTPCAPTLPSILN